MRLPIVSCLTLAAASSALAQSPDVHADRTVTFRYAAPNAKEVIVRSEALAKNLPLTKDDKGNWSATTEPLAPDLYVYSFQVDGLRVLDPLNPFIKYNLFSSENQMHVPGPKDLPWEINDVPRGAVHQNYYRSAVVGEERNVWVYTPPGYDAAAAAGKKFPALYLLHGYSDSEDSWVTIGRANVIFDNLIARGQMVPMVVVMPRGYGNRAVIANGWGSTRGGGGQNVLQDSYTKFRESLFTEIIPLIEKTYRVNGDRTQRAIAGLSMGGAQTLQFGLGAPDKFTWVASMGAGGLSANYDQGFAEVDAKMNDRLRLLWVGCGTDDSLIANNRKFHEWLTARGVKHTWVETPGRHSFTTWRRYLAQVAPLLFRDS